MGFVLIVGATSDIAKSVAAVYSSHGYDVYLAARNTGRLSDFAAHLEDRYRRRAKCVEFDLLGTQTHKDFYDSLDEMPEGLILATGYLGDQDLAERDFTEARKIIETNFTAAVSLLEIVAADLARRRSGFIVAISSVAGDRGKRSNYVYGAAKGGLSVYLSGLRSRLFHSGVDVLTVKPGFVATKMTQGLDLPPTLTTKPDDIARQIFKAQQSGKSVLYSKWVWKWIMFILKAVPEPLFKRMAL